MGLNYINNRLKTALSFVENCRCMADIGSDHGYSSIWALEHNLAENVIATDISKPSLNKTEKIVEEFSHTDKVQCRCGDGFKVLKPLEADVALIAGMGSDLIADIIEQSEDVSRAMSYMVLQPMNSAEPLRKRLTALGYEIVKEGVVTENGKWYSILKVISGKSKELSEAESFIGTFVFKEKIPFAEEYINHLIEHYEKIIGYVGKNATPAAEDGINEAKRRLEILGEALQWIKS